MSVPQEVDAIIPTPVRTTYEKLDNNQAYLLENGLVMFLWVGAHVEPQVCNDNKS